MTDPFEHADAAYAIGALEPSEAAEYEAHLRTCAACRARVEEARATAALLAMASDADFLGADLGPFEPVPETLLPGLLRRARRERRRRTFLTAGIAAVIAGCLVALAFLVWPSGSSNSTDGSPGQAFVALAPSKVTATARLTAKGWGTQIDVRCKYAATGTPKRVYTLQVTDKGNETYTVGGWSLIPGKTTYYTSATSVPANQIAKVQILRADGVPILRLTP